MNPAFRSDTRDWVLLVLALGIPTGVALGVAIVLLFLSGCATPPPAPIDAALLTPAMKTLVDLRDVK